MNVNHAIILGIIEGMTEFLPISSTFHLILASHLMGIADSDFTKVFEVVIQSGAILAVALLYLKEVWEDKRLGLQALAAFFPTALIGFLMHDIIKTVFFEAKMLQLGVIVLVGVLFVVVEMMVSKQKIKLNKTVEKLSYKQAVLIGLAQSLAIIPGVSRAGSVIITMMFMQFRREEAARFSFLLAVPTIFAASAYDAFKMRDVLFADAGNLGLLAVGFIVSAITAFIVVRWFLNFLKTNTLIPFALYRFILVIVLLLAGYLSF
jgi:undecaprenyl-diphosphatase